MLEKIKCTGCSACGDICPKRCIQFNMDEEGFYYPVIDGKLCVECKACENVCPVLHQPIQRLTETKCYALKNKNYNIQIKSSSGGVFSEIAFYVLRDKGIVWGAMFDKEFNVVHSYVTNENDLYKISRSKYVQSRMDSVYIEIRKQLQNGLLVLFSGTPCQVTALSNFLNTDRYKNQLILIDIVCHGVPSPMIWQEFLKTISKKFNKRREDIKYIAFKIKDNSKYEWTHSGFSIEWKDDKYIDYANCSWYENGFLGNLYVRPSCHSCEFKNLKSTSDITIGDFWGCDKVIPAFNDRNGVSILFTQTDAGKKLFGDISNKFEVIPISVEDACRYNYRITNPTPKADRRNFFWENYKQINNERSYDQIDLLIAKSLKPKYALKLIRHWTNKVRKYMDDI
ncbi:Coenzyme F420 hydrogenase/dehydrogenase, beta subunit C-terminal domain [[Clostridium] fimetarium]|uniref:Coenzyme F420-reducing hydrogenase, beta subunit n=1 Tax=[Clostridium] fimetarium TaxID=99656 RepID=A0A1I0RN49_9FIRM|nr:Coenzyme F420 hydrogenase/dehydrogenase, beta subunit C-terminal domain [[Clostridium] fimetarium]SEW42643.1 Coenzyme F420-reducing hydrogenase, beta subunit [[Clostridium] fimetarium]